MTRCPLHGANGHPGESTARQTQRRGRVQALALASPYRLTAVAGLLTGPTSHATEGTPQ